MNKRKAQLQSELKKIFEAEEKALIEEHYPKFKNKYEGKCFKIRNRYGGDSKGWWLYVKVTEIKPEDVYDTSGNGVACKYTGWQFQVDEHGNINISKEDFGYCHSLGQLISEGEFNAAWNKMIDLMDKLL